MFNLNFNPHPPCGGWRSEGLIAQRQNLFQSTPSVWRVTRRTYKAFRHWKISIHTLRVEGDKLSVKTRIKNILFQSTPSVWRVTWCCKWWWLWCCHFNPHPPCGGWLVRLVHLCFGRTFQSTLSVWRVTFALSPLIIASWFQSTPSVWRVTPSPTHFAVGYRISIHTLRVEGDGTCLRLFRCRNTYFNPHPPCGGWPNPEEEAINAMCISIHTLRVEGDLQLLARRRYPRRFQSTPSVWRVTDDGYLISDNKYISIHTLRVEGDLSNQFEE